MKYAPADLNGYLAASVFRIDQNHGLATDARDPMFQVQTGEVRARGFELEAVLELLQGLKVRGAYTYLDTENVAGERATLGRTLSGTPRHSFSAWADYTFQRNTALAGLGVGVGVRYVGTSWGDSLNTFGNAPHTLVDARLSYDLGTLSAQLKGVSAQINAQNLFNRDYITCDAGYCYQGMPRTVIASVKYSLVRAEAAGRQSGRPGRLARAAQALGPAAISASSSRQASRRATAPRLRHVLALEDEDEGLGHRQQHRRCRWTRSPTGRSALLRPAWPVS